MGGEDFNLELSRRRAAAVKDYLVKSLRMDGDKILTRGKGKSEPLVLAGTVEEQELNRRVEIRMRKTQPPPVPERVVPPLAPVEVPKAAPVKMPRAAPVKVPKAVPLDVPKAVPVEELDPAESSQSHEIPRAKEVNE